MKSYTHEQIKEMKRSAVRELAFRKQVYSRQIKRGRMHPAKAQRETEAMEMIVELLDKMLDEAAGVQPLPLG